MSPQASIISCLASSTEDALNTKQSNEYSVAILLRRLTYNRKRQLLTAFVIRIAEMLYGQQGTKNIVLKQHKDI